MYSTANLPNQGVPNPILCSFCAISRCDSGIFIFSVQSLFFRFAIFFKCKMGILTQIPSLKRTPYFEGPGFCRDILLKRPPFTLVGLRKPEFRFGQGSCSSFFIEKKFTKIGLRPTTFMALSHDVV